MRVMNTSIVSRPVISVLVASSSLFAIIAASIYSDAVRRMDDKRHFPDGDSALSLTLLALFMMMMWHWFSYYHANKWLISTVALIAQALLLMHFLLTVIYGTQRQWTAMMLGLYNTGAVGTLFLVSVYSVHGFATRGECGCADCLTKKKVM